MIDIETSGIRVVINGLRRLGSDETSQAISKDVAEFIKGRLAEYPPYKYVSRKAAYGVTFFSDKQRRYFFWALGKGIIKLPYRRTKRLQQGWKVQPFGRRDHQVINEVPYGPLVKLKAKQSRHAAAIGHKTVEDIVKESKAGAIATRIKSIANQTIKGIIRRLGL